MALAPVLQLIKNRLPYLHSSYDPTIEQFITESYYFLQSYLNKLDADVEVEASYRPLERMLVADLTAYQLIKRKAIETSAGTETQAPAAKMIKRAKADVVETEFMTIKASDGTFIQLDTVKLIAEITRDMCAKAEALGIGLPYCPLPTASDVIPPFLYIPD